jgi:hypothetical protein
MTAFWYIALCILVQVDRCFRSAYCLHYQSDLTVIFFFLTFNPDTGQHVSDDVFVHQCKQKKETRHTMRVHPKY